jgi:hypothetical protein
LRNSSLEGNLNELTIDIRDNRGNWDSSTNVAISDYNWYSDKWGGFTAPFPC